MATIISFMCNKGGVGRSTLALITATAFHHRTNYRCLLVDLDHKHSLVTLRKLDEKSGELQQHGVPIIPLDPEDENYVDALRSYGSMYDFIFIDAPKEADRGIEDILNISDIVIVPLRCSTMSMHSTLRSMKEIYKMAPKKMKLGVINLSYSEKSNRQVREIFDKLPIQVLDSFLSDRVSYGKASTLEDIKSDEFNNYFNELESIIKPIQLFDDAGELISKIKHRKETTRIRISTEIIDQIKSYTQEKGFPHYRPIVEQLLSDGFQKLLEQEAACEIEELDLGNKSLCD